MTAAKNRSLAPSEHIPVAIKHHSECGKSILVKKIKDCRALHVSIVRQVIFSKNSIQQDC